MPPVLVRKLDRSFASTRDTPVNLDDSLYALVPIAAVSAAEENNTTLTDTLRIDSRDTRDVSNIPTNTKNPIFTLAPQLVNKDLQAQHRLGSSSENRYGEVSGVFASYRHDNASNILEASSTDGVGKWSQQIIAEFDTEFVADTAVTAKSSGREPYVPLGDAQRAPFWIAGTGMMSADTAVSAASSAARVACRPPAPAVAQRIEYVMPVFHPHVT